MSKFIIASPLRLFVRAVGRWISGPQSRGRLSFIVSRDSAADDRCASRDCVTFNYCPRSRPNRPIVHIPDFLCSVKTLPEEWYQATSTLKTRPYWSPGRTREPLHCHVSPYIFVATSTKLLIFWFSSSYQVCVYSVSRIPSPSISSLTDQSHHFAIFSRPTLSTE